MLPVENFKHKKSACRAISRECVPFRGPPLDSTNAPPHFSEVTLARSAGYQIKLNSLLAITHCLFSIKSGTFLTIQTEPSRLINQILLQKIKIINFVYWLTWVDLLNMIPCNIFHQKNIWQAHWNKNRKMIWL